MYLKGVAMGRYDNLRRIQQLDPQKDATEIYTITGCHEFPWDQIRSLEVALYRTYCVPMLYAFSHRAKSLFSTSRMQSTVNIPTAISLQI